jgi:hypothetical protein
MARREPHVRRRDAPSSMSLSGVPIGLPRAAAVSSADAETVPSERRKTSSRTSEASSNIAFAPRKNAIRRTRSRARLVALSGRPCAPLAQEGVGPRSGQAHILQVFDSKPAFADQIVDLAVEVTAAGEARPQGIQPILPACDTRLGRASMLDKEQSTSWSQHAAHIGKRTCGIRHRAQRPGRNDGVDAPAIQRDRFSGGVEQCNGPRRFFGACARRAEELG